jgi:hypothetical protein
MKEPKYSSTRTQVLSPAPGQPKPPTYLQADEFAVSPKIGWWYRFATPSPPVGRLATLPEREKVRRARLGSIILAVQLVFIEAPVIPVVMNAPNHAIVLPWLIGCILALFVAFFCDRQGWLTVAGLLMVASIEITVGIKIMTVPGGIGVFSLPQFDILVQPILIAVALLPPWSAFAVAGINIAFLVLTLILGPHAADLTLILHNPTQAGDAFAVPIMNQVITATFSFLIVRTLLKAFRSVDQAEQIAQLEHAIADSRSIAEQRNQQLEMGVNAIIEAIQHVSNKGSGGRVELDQGNVLWPVVKQITLFLDCYQHARGAEAELERTKGAIHEFANEVFHFRQERRPFQMPPRRNTPMDEVIIACSRAFITGPNLPHRPGADGAGPEARIQSRQ